MHSAYIEKLCYENRISHLTLNMVINKY